MSDASLNHESPSGVPSEVLAHHVPLRADHTAALELSGELVLLDGWTSAWVLNPSGAAIWQRIDGHSSWREIAVALSAEHGAELEVVLADVIATARRLRQAGLLASVRPADGGLHVALEPTPQVEVGTIVDAVVARDLDGVEHSLTDVFETDALLINWNPHCGYCAGVAPTLAELDAPLSDAGVTIVLAMSGDPSANRELLRTIGWDPAVLVVDDANALFHGSGTPSAYHLDSTRTLASPPAYGTGDLVGLAERLAGIDRASEANAPGSVRVRYLLERDGVCAPGAGNTPGVTWTQTLVYRLGDHHVGVRADSDATAAALDRLFPRGRVNDPRAGHSFSIALPALDAPSRAGVGRGLNLLIQPGRTPIRSRDPARILRALLTELDDRVNGVEPNAGCIRVNAIAVRNEHGGIGLLPPNFHAFAPRLQPLLAQRGMAVADNRWPEIDLDTREVVVPVPQIPHDPRALDDLAGAPIAVSELTSVRPGRYPLVGWCSIYPGDHDLVVLSPAQGATANLSFVLHTGSPVGRLTELGKLFAHVPAYGLWYLQDAQLGDLIAAALNRADSEPRVTA